MRLPSGDHAGVNDSPVLTRQRTATRAVGIHDPHVAHGRARRSAHVRDQLAVGRPRRIGLLGVDVRDAARVRAVRSHRVDVARAGECDGASVGRPRRVRVAVLGRRQLRRPGAVRVHHVDVGAAAPPARKGDSRSVGGPRRLDLEEDRVLVRRIALGLGQPPLASAVGGHHEDRVVAVSAADERQVGARRVVAPAACACGQRGDCEQQRRRDEPASRDDATSRKTSERAARRRGSGAGGQDRRRGRRGRLGGDAAADHDELALGERGRDAEVLLDEEDREPLCLEELERLDEPLDDRRRKALRGLVHDEDPRVRDERATDREHLLLAAGELRSAVALPLGEAREQLVDALARPLAAVRLAPAARDAQVLVDRERREEAAALGHVPDASPRDLVRGDADEFLPVEEDRALRARWRDSHDRVAERRLAHPVSPDDRDRLVAHREAHVLERLGAPVVRAQPRDLEQRVRRRLLDGSGGCLTHVRSRGRGRDRGRSRWRGSRRACPRRSRVRRASSSPARRP